MIDGGMSGADMRCLREFLGLTPQWMARRLNVAERTIHRWEAGVSGVPEGVAMELDALENAAAEQVTAHWDVLTATGTHVLRTWRKDSTDPDAFPASWHRAICARVDQILPVTIEYLPDPVLAE